MSAVAQAAVAAAAAASIPDDPLDSLPADAVAAVAMSGGVDSSVAAARCAERGLHTVGITLAMWPRDRATDRDRGCCSVDAVDDARRVAATLGIAHYAWNLEDGFRDAVITDFEDEYASGRTPNPCVRCNERIKFGALLERALQVGATHLATGHYARTGRRGDAFTLHRAVAGGKDQSYTLHRLDQRRLSRAVFPLGASPGKGAVRDQAHRLGLVTAAKAESQELCFVSDGIRVELQRRLAGRYAPGPIVDAGGSVLGEHRGLPFYTVGQRAGLGLHPRRPDSEPRYVIRLDPASNTVVVGEREALLRSRVRADACNWVGGPPAPGSVCEVQLRAHGAPHAVVIQVATAGQLEVRTLEPVAQVSPGQALVVYRGDEVLGGGIVAEAD
jgi:tRNA-specific 2-thiouridylase